MSGRFCLSRSPPQPKTTISFRGDKFAQRFQNVEQRVGRVRVIDEDLELPFRRNGFEPARHLRRFAETQNRFAQTDA